MTPEELTRRRFLTRAAAGALVAGTASALLPARPAWAAPAKAGEVAPGFTVNATNAAPENLASYNGTVEALDGTNHQCPYVRQHYEHSNMHRLQREGTRHAVVPLSL